MGIIKTHTGRPTEFLTSIFSLVWGLWVINPFVDTFSNTPTYQLMGAIFPEWIWGALFSIAGLFGMLAMFFGKATIRATALVLQSFLFVTLSIFSLMGNPAGPAGAIFLVIAVGAIVAYSFVLDDVKHERGTHVN